MHVKGKRVLDPDRYLAGIPDGSSFRIVFELGENSVDILAKAGFGTSPASGDTMSRCCPALGARFQGITQMVAKRYAVICPRKAVTSALCTGVGGSGRAVQLRRSRGFP